MAHKGKDLPHFERQRDSARLLVDKEPFIMLAGEIHNSSSSDLKYLEWVLDRVAALNCNTVIAPVYWELAEPREGRFDWRLVDGLVRGSRKRGLKLVPLWFGTWKNASSDYCPEWVKTDLARFPRAETAPGNRINAISALSAEALRSDARAFAAFMKRLKAIDSRHHTVIAVQVENETGLLGAPRDRSPAAEQAFNSPIPPELARALRRGPAREEIASAWKEAGSRTEGTWSQVFGAIADEVFMAWHVGRYVGEVAKAGRKEYDLPTYANAWLVWEGYRKPGDYPSGGPVSRMLDIWRAAAPSIECLAPDIYAPDFAGVCADYARDGNPLLIPEAQRGAAAAANACYCLAEHDALCFAPFGIEDVPEGEHFSKTYALLAEMIPLIAQFQGMGRMKGILKRKPVTEEENQDIELAGRRLEVNFPAREEGSPVPGGLIIATGKDEYVATGYDFRIDFPPDEKSGLKTDFLSIDEGAFRKGKWIPERRLNGDERHVWFGHWLARHPGIIRARIYSY